MKSLHAQEDMLCRLYEFFAFHLEVSNDQCINNGTFYGEIYLHKIYSALSRNLVTSGMQTDK